MADIATYRAKKAVAAKIKAAQRAAKEAGQPFDLSKIGLTDDERTLMGLPRLTPSPLDVASTATQFAGEYPEAAPSDLRDFAAALMGTLPPVPFETSQPTGKIPSVAQMGPPTQAQLGKSRTELAQEREFKFRKEQTAEEAVRAKEAGIAGLSANVSSITGLNPEEAKTVASYYFGEPQKGPLPKNLKALADFAQTHANLAATKALYLERLASMQAAGLEAQINYAKLLRELEKNPDLDRMVEILKDMKGAGAEQMKAALATQLARKSGIIGAKQDIAADPTGLKGIVEFIFGSFGKKIAPGDVAVTPGQATGTVGGAGAAPPVATPPMSPDLAPFGLPPEIAKELGVAPGTEPVTIPGRSPVAPPTAVAPTAAPGAGKKPESQSSMQGLGKMLGTALGGQPVRKRDGTIVPMSASELVEDYINQYDMQEERANELRRQAATADAKRQGEQKKVEGVKKQESMRDSLLEHLLAGAPSAKDVVTTASKLSEVAGEHGSAIAKAALKRIPEIAKQRAKEAVAKELADAVLTFLKARKKGKERAANRPAAEGNR